MKKFTKIFLSCAAITAVSAAIGVSAMAAPITGDVQGTFNEADKTVTIENADDLGADTTKQITFLVFKGKADTDISQDSIKGIDQGTTVQPVNNGLMSDVETPTEGQDTYTVKVGFYDTEGAFQVKSGTFKLGTASGEDILIGDVNLNGVIDGSDGSAMARYIAEYTTIIGKMGTEYKNSEDNSSFLIGDVNLNGVIDGSDGSAMARYIAEYTTIIGKMGTTVNAAPVE